MAQPQALKSAYGQNPSGLSEAKAQAADEFVEPLDASDYEGVDIVPPDAAMQQEQQQAQAPQQQASSRPFVGPFAPEFYQGQTVRERFAPMEGMFPTPGPQYLGAEGIIEPPSTYSPKELVDLSQLGTNIAVSAALPALGPLGVGTTEAAMSLFFDTLKNQVNKDSQQISTPEKMFNAALTGFTAGATTGATNWFLSKVIGKAAKTGDEAILEQAKNAMRDKFGEKAVKESIEAAEQAGVKLTPAEAFPFDKEAQVATIEGLREHPNLGIEFANRIGKYKQAIVGLFSDAAPMEKSGTVRDFVDETIKSYRTRIGSIQKQLNQAGADMSDVRMDGQKLLSALDDRMKQINGDLKDDVLNAVAPEMNTIRNELSNALKKAEAVEFIKGETSGVIIDSAGNPIQGIGRQQKVPAKLTLNDIEKFRDRISGLTDSAYNKLASRQPLSRSEEMAKAMYKDVARLRDEMSEQIATKMGRPELAKEVQSLRKEYSAKIDAWETISDRLSKAPVDELKYLFPKNDPELAGKIVSVLKPEQVSGLKREFVNRLIDPVYLREAGEEAAANTLSTARKQFASYDPGVLKSIYSDSEIGTIKRFLDLGERAEKVLSKTGMPTGKVGIVKQITNLVSNPANSNILSGFIDNLATNSPLRKAMDYRLYLVGKRAAGDLSADAVRALGAPEAGVVESVKAGAAAGVKKFQDIIPQAAKQAVPVASQIAGRAAAGSVSGNRQEEAE